MNSNRLIFLIPLAIAAACARTPSSVPLSRGAESELGEGPRSDRRAKDTAAPAPPSAPSVAVAPSVAPSASAAPKPEAPAADLVEKKSEDVASARGKLKVELIDAGKEPRRKLRFVYHDKEVLKMRVRQDISMNVEIGGKTRRQPMPAMEVDGSLETLSVDAQGSARRRGTFSSVRVLATPGVTPELLQQVEKQLAGFTNITVNDLVSTRGESLEQETDLSALKDPKLKEMMEGMAESLGGSSVPFPEEAVGVGARWRVQRQSKVNGQPLAHDTTMRLVALKKDLVQTEFNSFATSEKPSSPKPGVTIESTSTKGSGQQRLTLDPMSQESTGTSETTTVSKMNDMAMTMHMTIKTTSSIRK